MKKKAKLYLKQNDYGRETDNQLAPLKLFKVVTVAMAATMNNRTMNYMYVETVSTYKKPTFSKFHSYLYE